MSEQKIRVGFVGAGANTRKHHIPKLAAQPGIELVAVANRSKESSERVAKEEKSRERLRKGELGLDFYGLRAKLAELGVQYIDQD